ncbi:hypothetical protein CSUI_010310, partial [Cystoisospora suis]
MPTSRKEEEEMKRKKREISSENVKERERGGGGGEEERSKVVPSSSSSSTPPQSLRSKRETSLSSFLGTERVRKKKEKDLSTNVDDLLTLLEISPSSLLPPSHPRQKKKMTMTDTPSFPLSPPEEGMPHTHLSLSNEEKEEDFLSQKKATLNPPSSSSLTCHFSAGNSTKASTALASLQRIETTDSFSSLLPPSSSSPLSSYSLKTRDSSSSSSCSSSSSSKMKDVGSFSQVKKEGERDNEKEKMTERRETMDSFKEEEEDVPDFFLSSPSKEEREMKKMKGEEKRRDFSSSLSSSVSRERRRERGRRRPTSSEEEEETSHLPSSLEGFSDVSAPEERKREERKEEEVKERDEQKGKRNEGEVGEMSMKSDASSLLPSVKEPHRKTQEKDGEDSLSIERIVLQEIEREEKQRREESFLSLSRPLEYGEKEEEKGRSAGGDSLHLYQKGVGSSPLSTREVKKKETKKKRQKEKDEETACTPSNNNCWGVRRRRRKGRGDERDKRRERKEAEEEEEQRQKKERRSPLPSWLMSSFSRSSSSPGANESLSHQDRGEGPSCAPEEEEGDMSSSSSLSSASSSPRHSHVCSSLSDSSFLSPVLEGEMDEPTTPTTRRCEEVRRSLVHLCGSEEAEKNKKEEEEKGLPRSESKSQREGGDAVEKEERKKKEESSRDQKERLPSATGSKEEQPPRERMVIPEYKPEEMKEMEDQVGERNGEGERRRRRHRVFSLQESHLSQAMSRHYDGERIRRRRRDVDKDEERRAEERDFTNGDLRDGSSASSSSSDIAKERKEEEREGIRDRFSPHLTRTSSSSDACSGRVVTRERRRHNSLGCFIENGNTRDVSNSHCLLSPSTTSTLDFSSSSIHHVDFSRSSPDRLPNDRKTSSSSFSLPPVPPSVISLPSSSSSS